MPSVNPEFDPTTLTDAQADGFECVAGCGYNQLTAPDPSRPMRPVGFGPRGQVFVCSECYGRRRDEIAEQAAQAQAQIEITEAKAEAYAADVAARIAADVAASGLTDADLAEQLGIDPHEFRRLVDGRCEWTATTAYRLALVLDVPLPRWFDVPPADRIVRRRSDGVTMTAAELREYIASVPATSDVQIVGEVEIPPHVVWDEEDEPEDQPARFGLECAECRRLVCTSTFPLPPVTVTCPACSGL
ncbi:hypothetical protein [Nocardia cyriacigeorgica]|uniref:hypothetical protein n=1 Tax=Nocardia cyriacigeorgica TaxID=135487 RepID=UPI001894F958|nr:hypothetical protein [Nocardia cyriacigeorgica]MBF6285408.1 hypothetical protein [Nocardia cyriacigeorgica]